MYDELLDPTTGHRHEGTGTGRKVRHADLEGLTTDNHTRSPQPQRRRVRQRRPRVDDRADGDRSSRRSDRRARTSTSGAAECG
jgi:hypothetical protein